MHTHVFDRITLRCTGARLAIGCVLLVASGFGILGEIAMFYQYWWGAAGAFLFAFLALLLVQFPDTALERAKFDRLIKNRSVLAHPRQA